VRSPADEADGSGGARDVTRRPRAGPTALQQRDFGTQQIASAMVHVYCVLAATHPCLIAGVVRPIEPPFMSLALLGPTTPRPIGRRRFRSIRPKRAMTV
jgi:hypothetical protein